eukprot:TRINITY_DN14382_c0_g1_i1.p1 TRINITY_DN14382_c0_g1~~TRINITY_DN14382_c0_g1_i1.p1  ORF type:complete len:146 (+),score=40.59 TRINITY_DN14382_c0_g1_i1:261-698(+)
MNRKIKDNVWIGLKDQLELKEMDDWYEVTRLEALTKGGRGILGHFGSLASALMSAYPQHEWKQWRFVQVPKNIWQNEENRRQCILDWEKKLKIKEMKDWNQMRARDVMSIGGRPLLTHYGNNLVRTLQSVYPDYEEAKPFDFMKK